MGKKLAPSTWGTLTMAERDIDINLTNSNEVNLLDDPEVQQHIKRQVSILNRTVSRFEIEGAPKDVHYEWHPDDAETHARLTNLGFICNDELAKKSKFTQTDGTGSPRIGDVRLYTIPKKLHLANQMIERERAKRNMDPRRANEDFEKTILSEGAPGLEAVDADMPNAVSRISGLEVQAILNK